MELAMSPGPVLSKVEPGYGPQFAQDNFPDPPQDLNFRKLMVVLGPAVIAPRPGAGGVGARHRRNRRAPQGSKFLSPTPLSYYPRDHLIVQ